jgi:hypothetical protein
VLIANVTVSEAIPFIALTFVPNWQGHLSRDSLMMAYTRAVRLVRVGNSGLPLLSAPAAHPAKVSTVNQDLPGVLPLPADYVAIGAGVSRRATGRSIFLDPPAETEAEPNPTLLRGFSGAAECNGCHGIPRTHARRRFCDKSPTCEIGAPCIRRSRRLNVCPL